jgi:predicted GNAT family N-acyltransferase
MRVVVPESPEEFEKYFQLRYEVLRKPWHQPFSSVKDDLEGTSLHALLLDDQDQAAGVCRMQFNSEEEAQIRFMAIRQDLQGKGLGKLLLDHFDKLARLHQRKSIVLQARENAVSFYKRNGYEIREKTMLMWGIIQHYLMEKKL